MKCGSCVKAVEKIILRDPNVKTASVNLVTKTALLEFYEPKSSIDELIQTLTSKGFPSKSKKSNPQSIQNKSERTATTNWWNQWRELIIAISLLILSVLGHLVEGQKISLPILGTLPFHASLATFALIGPGRSILKRGLKAAISLVPTMDTLVGLGVSSAYLASLVALI